MDQIKKISVVAIISVILTIVGWLVARSTVPPAFDAKETTLLFFCSFLFTYFVRWLIKSFRKKQSDT
jgi:hypothetical protein